jgi:hypothetical protein
MSVKAAVAGEEVHRGAVPRGACNESRDGEQAGLHRCAAAPETTGGRPGSAAEALGAAGGGRNHR